MTSLLRLLGRARRGAARADGRPFARTEATAPWGDRGGAGRLRRVRGRIALRDRVRDYIAAAGAGV
jgi:hypothetical protein